MLIQEGFEVLPGEPALLAPLRKRVFPLPKGEVPKRLGLPRVPREPVVVEMTSQDLVDHAGLCLHGLLPHPSESLLHRGFCPAEALPLGLEHRLDGCGANALGPVNREAKRRQLEIAPGIPETVLVESGLYEA